MPKIIQRSSRLAASTFLVIGFVLLALSTIAADPRNHRSRAPHKPFAPAATPSSADIGPTGPTRTWTGFSAAPIVGAVCLDELACLDGTNCDTYTITLTGTPADWVGKKAHVKLTWAGANDDFDIYVHKGDNSGAVVGSSANSGSLPEEVDIDPSVSGVGTGTFTVHVVYFLVDPNGTYNGEITAIGASPTPTPNPTATPSPTPLPSGLPRFFTYQAPPGTGEDAGEPSIGSNWLTENVVRTDQTFANSNGPVFNGGTTTYYGGFLTEMLRITFDDCSSPAKELWEKKPLFLAATPRGVGDPILYTDHGFPNLPGTGRTFVTQEESQAGATTDVSDDDGENFMPSQGAGAPAGFDHETIGGGPFALPTPFPTPSYPKAVYFASQSVSDARASRSDDGGITFGPAIPMFTVADCDGLHGHIKVAPDGTVYVPDKQCSVAGVPLVLGGHASAVVSEDNGITWDIRPITDPGGAGSGEWDPSIGVATDGTVYLGFQANNNHAKISVSHNKGQTWSVPVDVGVNSAAVSGAPPQGIQNVVFPAVVAGDPDRAAFVFYGSTTADSATEDHTGGANNDPTLFSGVWYLYISTTYDGGAHWFTQNVTPNDPVQRGPICGDSTCRNLLDFFDATIDKRGRILVGWEDGCIGGCVNGGPNSFTAKATITRQSGGKGMFAAYDVNEPVVPGAPKVSGYLNATQTAIELSWPAPDNGGAFITAYKVYRKVGAGAFTLLATTSVPSYRDSSGFDSNVNNDQYHVTAVNMSGEGPYCGDFVPSAVPPPSPCVLPGILAINDLNPDGTDHDSGQNTPADGSVNVKQLFVAEPFISAGVDKLYFTLQVAPSVLGTAPPNSQWYIIWNRQGVPGMADPGDPDDVKHDRAYVAMKTDAVGTPTFEYGKFGIPINTSPPPPPDPAANSPKKLGDADAGSYNPLTGEIQIQISNQLLRAFEGGAGTYNAGSSLSGLNVRTYFNRPDPGQRSQNNASDITDDSGYSLVGNSSCAPVPQLVRAVSRKIHGAAGTFDIKLFPTGPDDGIECRRGQGPGSNMHQVILSFAAPVTYTGASVSAGSVTASPTPGSLPTNEVTLTVTAANAQTITISLLGVGAGGPTATVDVPFKILAGDTNHDAFVNSADISETKAKSGQAVVNGEDYSNFRNDVNVDGDLNSADIALAKSKSGTGLP